MYLKKIYVMFVLVWKLMFCEADAEKACSCYTFESDQKMTWKNAKRSCEYNKKHLVALETEREWQFLNNELKNRTTTNGSNKDEWHIGLFWSTIVKNWTWVNGKPLTITKWQPFEPGKNTWYGLIAKQWPKGKYGTFNGIRGYIQRAWICEDETNKCQGVCMHHNPATRTITMPRATTSTKETTRPNTPNHTDVSGKGFYFNCSIYTFHKEPSGSWENSKRNCEANGGQLVSMENLRAELSFLESQTKKSDITEYYIGLKYFNGNFRWISDNSTLQETSVGTYPWYGFAPSGNRECVKIWRIPGNPYFFDDIPCTRTGKYAGYICESSVECKYKDDSK